ncbi:MAG TPA: PASTA domain-containing protein [Terracidiphilus sp.]|jgi:beta-lactam-binding protein with PASTA domain|nr:PASTA domain-containing protein [Terracidiphilus sp.]
MSGHFLLRAFRAASLIVVLVVIALLSAITTMHFAIHGAEVQVPSLKGMTVADARSLTAGMGLNLNVDNRYYSGDVAAGHILTQSPDPATVVRREWHVRVAESLGPQKVDVPDIVGLDQRVAAFQLRRAGLDVGTIAKLPDDVALDGSVIAQDPPAHAQGIERPSVNLLVASSDDTTPDGYVMPDLSGIPIVAAQTQLANVGIKTSPPIFADVPIPPVGSGDAPPASPVIPGSVIAQSPPAGSRVDLSVEVKLTVAK